MIDIWTGVVDLQHSAVKQQLAFTCARGVRQVQLVEQLFNGPPVRVQTVHMKHPKTGELLALRLYGDARVDSRSFANLRWRLEQVNFQLTMDANGVIKMTWVY